MNWLIHGEGCGTFVQALRFIKANPVASDIITAQKGMAAQDVYFSNPRGRHTAKKDLEAICKSVGMNFVNVNLNKHDVLFNPDARKDLLKELLKAAGTISFTGGMSSYAAGEVGLDSVLKLWEMVTTNPEIGLTTGVAIAGGVVVVAGKGFSLCGFARNIGGAASSTFRQGNQNWAA